MIVAEKQNRLNEEINAREVRVIGVSGEQIGIMSARQAQELADEANLDLVELVPNAAPPVCRIMDYGKYLFDQSKKRQAAKRKQKQIQVKEIKFRPGTEEGDYQVKLRNIIRFLTNGDKVKVTLRFRGREMVHQELGVKMLERIEADLAQLGVIEQHAKLEGRQMIMVMAPKR
ncbi:MAG: translation initiation factor IF-3 [Gammaproteobacteria bacterium]|nr:translation initiation factor IF-3 [Gammaproteobacteria bacterium]